MMVPPVISTFFFKKHLFDCVACGFLVPRPGVEPLPPALGTQSLNHRTTRRIQDIHSLIPRNQWICYLLWKKGFFFSYHHFLFMYKRFIYNWIVKPKKKRESEDKEEAQILIWHPIQKARCVIEQNMPCSQCRGPGFNPWSGNWSLHVTTKSSHATTKDPACCN